MQDLARITADVTARLGPVLRGLWLVGSYGRGEGGFVEELGEVRAANDYDLVAVLRAVSRRERAVLRGLEEELSAAVGVHVDIFPLPEVRAARLPPTLLWLDAARGSQHLAGEVRLRSTVADSRSVSLEEAGRLLANRAVGLALSRLGWGDDATAARHVHKAVLALGDALLLAIDHYAPTQAARLRRLEELVDAPAVGPEFVAAYRSAVTYRARPDRWQRTQAPGGGLALLQRLLPLLAAGFLGFEARRLRVEPELGGYVDGPHRVYPTLRDVSGLAQRVRGWLPGVHRFHPRERLARAAFALAFAPENPSLRQSAARWLGMMGAVGSLARPRAEHRFAEVGVTVGSPRCLARSVGDAELVGALLTMSRLGG